MEEELALEDLILKQTYLNLVKYETEDKIAAARQLGTRPYIDASRVGIWAGVMEGIWLFRVSSLGMVFFNSYIRCPCNNLAFLRHYIYRTFYANSSRKPRRI